MLPHSLLVLSITVTDQGWFPILLSLVKSENVLDYIYLKKHSSSTYLYINMIKMVTFSLSEGRDHESGVVRTELCRLLPVKTRNFYMHCDTYSACQRSMAPLKQGV